MKRKALALLTAFLTVFVFFLVGFESVAIESALGAKGEIIIAPDGAVLGTSQIQRYGSRYVFNQSIQGSIVVMRDNIVVDGAGYSLIGDGAPVGIDASFRNNVTIENMEITGFYDEYGEKLAILMDQNANSMIINNNISRNGEGISMRGSKNITILGNRVTDYTDHGIIILESENIAVKGNTILPDPSVRTTYGLTLYESKYCLVRRNNIARSYPDGLIISYSSENVISENYVANNYVGIYVNFGGGNLIIGNTITENERWGMRLSSQENWPGDIIYHNNFVNNNQHNISEELQVSNPWFWGPESNTWDNGKEGNYWSDYKMRYPGAREIDDSGVGNWAFFINPNNIDRYPLMEPWVPDITSPVIVVLSPENKTYTGNAVSLNFTVDEPISQMSYSLDAQEKIPVTQNITLAGLSSGPHSLTVYAQDTAENIGVSETINFNLQEYSLTTPVVATAVIVAIIGIGSLVYFKKRKR